MKKQLKHYILPLCLCVLARLFSKLAIEADGRGLQLCLTVLSFACVLTAIVLLVLQVIKEKKKVDILILIILALCFVAGFVAPMLA